LEALSSSLLLLRLLLLSAVGLLLRDGDGAVVEADLDARLLHGLAQLAQDLAEVEAALLLLLLRAAEQVAQVEVDCGETRAATSITTAFPRALPTPINTGLLN
jgi:hypothetical protein